MRRFGQVLKLRPEHRDEYVREHAAVWPDMRAMAADPATRRWWALMEPMQEKWPTASAEEWWTNMTEVFHLE
jgi:L-rhamnose mutarotase